MKQLAFLILSTFCAAAPVFAQSTNENFPTPILQNEVSGKIAARDVGDARLTRHFYAFFADNGDVNLEIETANFDGDIDLFESGTLRPLAKITIAADAQSSKTSRIIYFRKRAQIVLRIEGRSLTDAAASYQIAFSGSFAAASELPQPPADVEPKVADKLNSESGAKVNSAGTIIETLQEEKSTEEIESTAAKPEPAKRAATIRRNPRSRRPAAPKPKAASSEIAESSQKSSEKSVATEAENRAEINADQAASIPVAKNSKPKPAAANRRRAAKTPATKKAAEVADATAQPDPLANVQLVILLKNGTRAERPMSEVFNVSVDKRQITVITKNGKILRYNLLEVQKMVIE